MSDKEIKIPFVPSTYETIDFSLFNFVDKELNLHCNTSNGWQKVPVVWSGTERSFRAKNNPNLQDNTSTLIFPIISIEKTSISKNEESKGKFYANIMPFQDGKGGSILIGQRIKQDKTANFANADSFYRFGQINFPLPKNNKVVYEMAFMPQPVYNQIDYTIRIVTDYQQQMNDLLTPFLVAAGSVKRVILSHEHYKYEAFFNPEITQKNNVSDLKTEHRKFEAEITLKVHGYLLGDNKNGETPFISIRENYVEYKIPRERSILGDIPIHFSGSKYR